ncbi:MAG: superoxide dismutase [Paludibacteraceae bacterium]|nr:superoxide dismutase [Paludibacteraceae bacterium]
MKQIIITIAVWVAAMFASAQFSTPTLGFGYGALEPYIDSTTMFIHLNNHHAAYVNNLNNALSKYPDLQKKSIEALISNINALPVDIRTAVRNNGGGHYNHTLFWTLLAPAGSAKMSAKLEKKLNDNFGSVDKFKAEFENAAATRFGSGWAWMLVDKNGKLTITSTPNQDNPLMKEVEAKGKIILAIDVWEHAYYLKYQSKRAAYVKSFWEVVNWKEVEKLMCTK